MYKALQTNVHDILQSSVESRYRLAMLIRDFCLSVNTKFMSSQLPNILCLSYRKSIVLIGRLSSIAQNCTERIHVVL